MALSTPSPAVLDVIVVPDFAGQVRHRFEANTLLFLASWLENAGDAHRFPLHLACIGEPPPSVEKLADRAGAHITIHESLRSTRNRFLNKFRAADVEPRAASFALLDADMIVLGDPSALGALATGSVAAAREMHPRVAPEAWKALYESFGVEPPSARVASGIHVLDLPLKYEHFAGERRLLDEMIPLYNGGLVVAPWSSNLLKLWQERTEKVLAMDSLGLEGWAYVQSNDQPTLALTIDLLQREGRPFVCLPDEINTLWQILYSGALGVDGVRVFHATTMFRHMRPGPLTPDVFTEEIDRYCSRLWRRSRRLWTRGLTPAGALKNTARILRAPATIRDLRTRMNRLYDAHIRELLQG